MKKLTKVLVAALATVTLGVSVASPASAATVNYVDYDKTTETIRKISNKENQLKQTYKLVRK